MAHRTAQIRSKSVGVGIAVLLLCGSCTNRAWAQGGLPYTIAPPQDSVDFGRTVASGGDVDGDGLPDIFVADPSFAINNEVVGRWFVYSGVDGSLIWTVTGDRPCQSFQEYMIVGAFIGDVDSDQRADVLVGIPNADALRGVAYVYSGRTGELIFQISGDQSEDRLGLDVTGLDDLNGDRAAEFAIITQAGAPGSVAVYDGAAGEVIFHSPRAEFPPRRVRNGGDLDGDTVSDIVVGTRMIPNGSGPQGEVFAFSGRDGLLLWTIRQGDSYFGWNLETGIDLTGDEVPDVLARGGNPPNTESIELISGATGQIVASHLRLIGGINWGSAMALADVNADGSAEFVAMGIEQGRFGFDVVNPKSWRTLHWAEGLDPRHQFAFFSGNEMAVADVNGDDAADFILGSVGSGVRVFGGSPLLLNFDQRRSNYNITPGQSYDFIVGGAKARRVIHLLGSITGNGCTFIAQLGICIDLDRRIYRLGAATTDPERVAHFTVEVPLNMPIGPMWLQAIDPADPNRGPITSNVMELEIVD